MSVRGEKNKNITLFPAGYVIEVVGNVASGKSTLARMIAQNSNLFYADLSVHAKNPFLPLYVKRPNRWAFQTDLFFSYERSKKVSLVTKKLDFNPVVLDPGFDMGIFVYSKAMFKKHQMTKDEWSLLEKIHRKLVIHAPKIVATIFLDVPANTLLDRIRIRGREHEQHYTKRYVEELEEALEEYKTDLIALRSRRIIVTYSQLVKSIQFHGKPDAKIKKLLSSL